ncbi:hypothetical protein [Polaromonas sp. AET17H-212]|jgi:cell division protein FtsB|uniref:hypothetical protein n=1 Tax=Polaromonas sp. AET17H-212 TaxID=1977061 RepID=UPI0011434DE8|nr:hypothetical protein [Polaromonas sp. AET17H-212]
MKKLFVVLFASALGFGMAVHAQDTKGSAIQAQVKKLRTQADQAHKRGDSLTARADKLESQAAANPGEKMRSFSSPADGASTQSKPSVYKPSPRNVGTGVRG